MVATRKCAECRGANVRVEHKPLTEDFGLDNPVTIEGVAHIICADCGEVSTAMQPAKITRAIVEAIAGSDVILSPKEIAYLRRSMDLSQEQLGGLIGLSQEHLSRCETGKTPLGDTAERLLRLVSLNKLEEHDDLIDKALIHEEALDLIPPPEHHLHLSL